MRALPLLTATLLCIAPAATLRAQTTPNPIINPLTDTNIFPIAVWAMGANTAPAFSKLGVNTFVGNQGNSKTWCDAIAKSQCVGFVGWSSRQSDAQRQAIASSPGFLGWMHGDEPDNPGEVNGEYRPYHVLPSALLADYNAMKKSSTPAPMYLNLGQGLANANAQTTPDSIYPTFCQTADVVCYDVYPVSTQEDGANRLDLVARGVQRLRQFAGPDKPVWIWLECTRLAGDKSAIGDRCPFPHELRAEIWMSILYGANGIGYFPHQFDPYKGGPAAIPADLQMEMTLTDGLLQKLAPVLRTGKKETLTVEADKSFVAAAAWQKNADTLVVIANMQNHPAHAKITLPAGLRDLTPLAPSDAKPQNNTFSLSLKPYEIALYSSGQKVNIDYSYPAPPKAAAPAETPTNLPLAANINDLPPQNDNRKTIHWSRTQNTRIAIPQLSAAPTIDGNLNDQAWANAQPLSNFTNTAGTDIAAHQTTCKIGRFADKLYLAFHCDEPAMKDLVTTHKAAWRNDSVEFWFDPHNTRTSFAHFIATAAGNFEASHTIPDPKWPGEAMRDDDWKPQVECKAAPSANAWNVEIAIDLKDLGDPQKNLLWSFDAARERKPAPAENSVFTIGGFNAPQYFGEALFESSPAPVTLANATLYNWTDKEQTANVETLLSAPAHGTWFATWEDRWSNLAQQMTTFKVPPSQNGHPGTLNLLTPAIAQRVPKAGRVRFTLQSSGPNLFEEFIANPQSAPETK